MWLVFFDFGALYRRFSLENDRLSTPFFVLFQIFELGILLFMVWIRTMESELAREKVSGVCLNDLK